MDIMSVAYNVIDKAFRLSYDQGFIKTCKNVVDTIIRRGIKAYIFTFTKVDEKKVLFLNFTGNYDCNPKYICQELIDEGVNADLRWGVNKKTRQGPRFFPEEITPTIRDTYDCLKQLASAKVIIDNGISVAWLGYDKKPDQYLIETWHGSIGIKKFGRDSNKDMNWLALAEKEGNMTDFVISNSDFEDDVYKEDFWKTTEIWKFGHARNDILFADDEKRAEVIKKIKDWYELPDDDNVHFCLYGPTFRDDRDLSPYRIDYEHLAATLSTRFGGEWIILARFHSRVKKLLKKEVFPDMVVNVSGYPDIQELMLIADVGITDYSSWICEYMLTRKPGFFFATDYESFAKTNRTFFFPLTAYPFPVAGDQDTLFDNILAFDNEKFVDECNAFLADKGSVDDGHAAERIATEIKKLINED